MAKIYEFFKKPNISATVTLQHYVTLYCVTYLMDSKKLAEGMVWTHICLLPDATKLHLV
jgi:hypothetical protein